MVILKIPMGPMGMGIARLVSWEWELEWEWECLMGMGGNKNSIFPIYHPQVADHQTLLMDLCFA